MLWRKSRTRGRPASFHSGDILVITPNGDMNYKAKCIHRMVNFAFFCRHHVLYLLLAYLNLLTVTSTYSATSNNMKWVHCRPWQSGLDYGIGIVGKCLGPTTLKGPTKDGCIIFWTYVSQSVTNICRLKALYSLFWTLSKISPANRSRSGTKSVHMHRSRADNVHDILGAIG